MPETATPILEVRGLTKHFKSGNAMRANVVKALEDVSFKLFPGRVVALVGESGSGKSTTARLIAKLYEPTAGAILYEGVDVAKSRSRKAMLDYRSHVQMIFQDPFGSLNPVHRVEYILKRPLLLHKKADRRNIAERTQSSAESRLTDAGRGVRRQVPPSVERRPAPARRHCPRSRRRAKGHSGG